MLVDYLNVICEPPWGVAFVSVTSAGLRRSRLGFLDLRLRSELRVVLQGSPLRGSPPVLFDLFQLSGFSG